jgi:hypothetical protein
MVRVGVAPARKKSNPPRSCFARATDSRPTTPHHGAALRWEKSMRRSPEPKREDPDRPRWVRWLVDLPQPVYFLAAIVAAGLLAAFVLWLDERTLALVACGAFAILLAWWVRGIWREWRDAEPVERIIGVLGCLLLLGASAANLVRYLHLP